MILKKDIELAVETQRNLLSLKGGLINRTAFDGFMPTGNHIEVITGIRRCGKSTLMKQIISKYSQIAYFNFEDSRVHGFEVSDFSKLDEVFGMNVSAYFFDEIQNVHSWEVFVRQLHDRGSKVFITGSNAALLSSELGTRLTGRHLRHELFPFSFQEFIRYKSLENNADSFNTFSQTGGFPEYLDSGNPEILQNLLKDIVFRDIAVRYGIRNSESLMDITLYLLSNIGKEFSYNSLRKLFSLGAANTVSDYLCWLSDSYILFYLPRFNWSYKKTKVNPRKVYAIDNGLINANSLSFTKDRGRLIENAVFVYLRQQKGDLYYFREERECDFVFFKDKKCSLLIQVCEELNNDNLQREMSGLEEAMKYFKMNRGYILTNNQSDVLKNKQGNVTVLPVYQFITKL